MKKMKKFLALFMSILMICSMFTSLGITSFAASPTLVMTATKGIVGETITVNISGQDVSGLEAADFEINYDPAHLEFVNIAYPDSYDYYMAAGDKISDGLITWSLFYLDPADDTDNFAVITFKVLEETSSSVSVSINSWDGADYPDGGSVTVVSGTAEENNPSDEPENEDTPDIGHPYIEMTATEGIVGETITVNISGQYISGLESAALEINYDPAHLKFIDISYPYPYDYDMAAGDKISDGLITWSFFYLDVADETDNFAVITFMVLEDTTSDISVNINSWDGTDYPDGGSLTFTSTPASPAFAFEVNADEIMKNETFDVFISAENIAGLKNGAITIEYDSYILNCIDTEGCYNCSSASTSRGVGSVSYSFEDFYGTLSSTDIIRLTFKALNSGTAYINVSATSWNGTETPSDASTTVEILPLPDPDIYAGETKTITMTPPTEVIVNVDCTNFYGTESADLEFNYDPEVLEYIELTPASFGAVCSGGNPEPGLCTFSFMFLNAATADSELLSIRFKILKQEETQISMDIGSWDGTEAPSPMSLTIAPSGVAAFSRANVGMTASYVGGSTSSSLKFIPDETAEYIFSSSSAAYDPSAFICNADGAIIAENNDCNTGENPFDFSVVATLNEGELYFLNSELTNVQSGSYDVTIKKHVQFDYTTENDAVTITGLKANYGGGIEIPETIEGLPVVAIADEAFVNSTITSMIIPASVKSIGNSAFAGCYNLYSVSLKEGIETIGEYAFAQTDLGSLAIPASLSSIGYGSFNHCYALTEFTVDENNEAYCAEDGVLYNKAKTELIKYPRQKDDSSFTIPGTVKKIDAYAFENNCYLTTVAVSESVEEIAEYAFFSTDIANITIPSNVKTVGESAFEDCYYLQNATIENGVTSIGNKAFAECTNLNTVKLPESVTAISENMFFNCYSLKTVSIPEKTKTIGAHAFTNCGFRAVTIPDSVEEIGAYAFDQCYYIDSVSFGSGLKKIGTYAFSGCYYLTEVVIPVNVTTIEEKAFGYDYGKDYCYLDNFLIQGSTTSEAERYANDNNFRFEDPFCKHTNTEVKNLVAVTCTADGYSGDTFCADCGKLLASGVAVFATGHNTEHKTVPATCLKTGEEYDICINCGEISNKKEIPVSACTFGDWNVITKETCTQDGLKVHTCTVCGKEESEAIAKKGHTVEAIPGKAATCTENGLTDGEKCSVCGTVTVEQTAIPATGHSFGDWETTKEPTYIDEGERTKSCSCGEKQTEKIEKLVAKKESVDKSSNISVKFADDTYAGDVKVTATKQFDGSSYQILNNEKGKFKNTLFDITTTVNGNKVQPNGLVLVGIPLPAGYNEKETIVYYVANDGSGLKKMNSYYKDGFIWFETNHFSAYALVDESAEKPTYTAGDVDGDGRVTAADARLVLRVSAKLEEFASEIMQAADVVKDGNITAADARLILRVGAKLDSFN